MIKTFICLLLACTMLNSSAYSQKVSLGIKSGVSYTSITGRFDYKNFNNTEITYNKQGIVTKKVTNGKELSSSGYIKPTFGFMLTYNISNNFSLYTEFNYEVLGFDFKSLLAESWVVGYYKTQYFSVPLIFSYNVGKKINYYGYMGLSYNRHIKTRNYTITYSQNQVDDYPIDESYIPTEFNKYTFDALVGAGVKIPVDEKVKLFADIRYGIGITKATKNTIYDYNSNSFTRDTPNNFQNIFYRSATLCWGAVFKIGKKKPEAK